MRKSNKELKFNDTQKKKLTKFNYIVIIVPICLILLLAAGIAFYVFVYNNDINKMKRYLEKDGYICNESTCTKDFGSDIYTIDYVDNIFIVDNSNIQIRVGEETPVVDVKNKEMICTYVKDEYNWNFVDESFRYDKQCESYISEINSYLSYYMDLRQDALGD